MRRYVVQSRGPQGPEVRDVWALDAEDAQRQVALLTGQIVVDVRPHTIQGEP